MSVSTLIQGGAWNDSLIHQLFPSYIAGEILNIPIAGDLSEDSIFWRQGPKGRYSVRDGYKREIGCYEVPPNCSEIQARSWWKSLWALSIPPKARIFWWRAMHNIIPTEVNLLTHHVPVQGQCQLCNFGFDTTEHALFWCPLIKSCWKGTIFKSLLQRAHKANIVDIFLWMKEQVNHEEFESFAIRTWAVWHERLQLLHKNKRNFTSADTDWSIHLLNAYKEARKAIGIAPSQSLHSKSRRWKNPETNQFRLETDAAYNANLNRFSVGGAIRDHEGKIVLAFGHQTKKTPSVEYAELEAMREGLKKVKEFSLQIQEVTSDSLLAVQAVTSPEEDLSYTGAIAHEVRTLLSDLRGIKVNHVRRSANVVAHSIACFAISSPAPFVWDLENLPFWLVNLVSSDTIDS
ncbi:uncharacterized protein [Primulina eburnea]|uniref:uncharacterized protein n=1 Tax=Primulina eburnea TaxID=1245227 RepID=UPI003C6C3D36